MSLNCEQIKKEELVVIIDSEITEKGLVNHHLNSFNSFTSGGIRQIVTELFKVEAVVPQVRNSTAEDLKIKNIKYEVNFTKVYVDKPKVLMGSGSSGKKEAMFPDTARKQELSYASTVSVDVAIKATAFLHDGTTLERAKETVERFPIGTIPIMVGSERCNLSGLPKDAKRDLREDQNDPGGYFILKGGEWVISVIESRIFNSPHIFKNVGHEKELCRLEFISKPGDHFENSSEVIMKYINTGHIHLYFSSNPYLKNVGIPFYAVFRLFGMVTDKEICDNIVYGYENDEASSYMMNVLRKAMTITDPKFENLAYVTKRSEVLEQVSEVIAHEFKINKDTTFKGKNDDKKLYVKENLLKFLDKVVFPHIGLAAESRHLKLRFLGHLIHRMMLVEMGIVQSTDRDSLKNKRLDPAGRAYAKSFKRDFNLTIVQGIKKKFRQDFKSSPFGQVILSQSVKNSIDTTRLESALTRGITTGNKEITVSNKQVPNRLASEPLNRKNQMNTLATLRVNRTPSTSSSNKDQRADEMRRVHPSYAGYFCCIQSADTGEQVGMVKQLALGMSISDGSVSEIICDKLRKDPRIIVIGKVFPEMIHKLRLTKVFVNGYWVGCCTESDAVIRSYRELRRGYHFADIRDQHKFTQDGTYQKIEIDKNASIVWDADNSEINFWVDFGRPLRPVLVVRNNTNADPIGQVILGSKYNPQKDSGFVQDILLTKEMIYGVYHGGINITHLREMGIVEYLSPEEVENCLIAQDLDELRHNRNNSIYRYTHCEIPQCLIGLPAATCPFAAHNQPPRVTFQTNQGKQTTGYYVLNWADRADKHGILQYYCETPLLSTIAYKYIYPLGCNAVVAIGSYGGYNMEDSLIYNSSSTQRGLYKVEAFTHIKTMLENGEIFSNPDQNNTSDYKIHANHSKIINGLPIIGRKITKNDVVIGKVAEILRTSETRGNKKEIYTDTSIIYDSNEDATVIDVIQADNQDGNRVCKVKLSMPRELGIGDKFSSRHGQKGMTGGGYSAGKMPFTSSGLVIDFVLNVHAIPTRMTIGQLLEGNFAKSHAWKGTSGDATIFRDTDDVAACNMLEKLGFDRYGCERVFIGQTGEWIDVPLFVTPVFYQRLQKFVKEEVYSISTGPTCIITRQPLEGKGKKGGLRIGEMEKDVIISQGAGHFIMEKFRDDSDNFDIYVCRNCGQMPIVNEVQNIAICKICQHNGMEPQIFKTRSTWSSKLFLQELQTMSVGFKLKVLPFKYEFPIHERT